MKRLDPIKQGDTATFTLEATDSNDAAVDISTYTSASIKLAKDLNIANGDADYYESVLAASFTDGANGKHDFVISEDTTKGLDVDEYMVQIRLIDGSNTVTSDDIAIVPVIKNLIDNEA